MPTGFVADDRTSVKEELRSTVDLEAGSRSTGLVADDRTSAKEEPRSTVDLEAGSKEFQEEIKQIYDTRIKPNAAFIKEGHHAANLREKRVRRLYGARRANTSQGFSYSFERESKRKRTWFEETRTCGSLYCSSLESFRQSGLEVFVSAFKCVLLVVLVVISSPIYVVVFMYRFIDFISVWLLLITGIAIAVLVAVNATLVRK